MLIDMALSRSMPVDLTNRYSTYSIGTYGFEHTLVARCLLTWPIGDTFCRSMPLDLANRYICQIVGRYPLLLR